MFSGTAMAAATKVSFMADSASGSVTAAMAADTPCFSASREHRQQRQQQEQRDEASPRRGDQQHPGDGMIVGAPRAAETARCSVIGAPQSGPAAR